MRKLILFFLFVFSVTVGFAQSFSGDKLFISVDGGKGVLFGKSNLSPFGVNYRGEYNGGLTESPCRAHDGTDGERVLLERYAETTTAGGKSGIG